MESRLEELQETRNRRLNTPKTVQINELFLTTLGITEISKSWSWATKMTSARAKTKLDKFVTLRSAIAHRGSNSSSVKKSQVTDYFDFVQKLAAKTGGRVNTHLKTVTGKPLWTTRKRTRRAS